VNDLADLSEEMLGGKISIRMRVTGNSMFPFVRRNDVAMIEPLDSGPFRVGDILLYRTGRGKIEAHRLLRVSHTKHGPLLMMRGDASSRRETTIGPSQVLGLVTELLRDGRRIDLTHGPHRLAGLAWARTQPVSGAMIRFAARVRHAGRRPLNP